MSTDRQVHGVTEQRKEAVRRVLRESVEPLNIDHIAQRIREDRTGTHLLRVVSTSQTLGSVLRQLERDGEVYRLKRGYHLWGYREAWR